MSQPIISIAKAVMSAAGAAADATSQLAKRALNRTLAAVHASGDRRPWKLTYSAYRARYLRDALADTELLDRFTAGKPLPAGYGYRLDARVVEIPWVLSRARANAVERVLDAGSSLNYEVVVQSAPLKGKELLITTLAPERRCYWKSRISYVYADLRDLYLKTESFDAICCISTIEHVGMNNEGYAADQVAAHRGLADEFLGVIDEFKRILRPGGMLLITFPFGRYEDRGWFQQFDSALADHLISRFAPSLSSEAVYRYLPDGWQLSDRAASANCEFFDVRQSKYFSRGSKLEFPSDFRAGEGAVMCLELRK